MTGPIDDFPGANLPDLDALLGRYAAGACSAAERATVEAWAAHDPARRDLLEAMQIAWRAPHTGDRARAGTGAQWESLRRRIRAASHARRTAYPVWRSAAIAASLLAVAAGLGTLVSRRGVVGFGRATRVYTAAAGERVIVTLGDGSRVTLAPGSRIGVSEGFGQSTRDVSLDGEAYFAVVHDARIPFAVRTAAARVTDIGTRFDVRAFADDRTVSVAVSDGRVAVVGVGHHDSATVDAGEATAFDNQGRVGDVRRTDVSQLTAWVDGRLVFSDTPLIDAARTLGRWYDVDIRVTDPVLAQHPVTATFAGAPLPEILDALARVSNARWTRDGRVATLAPSDHP